MKKFKFTLSKMLDFQNQNLQKEQNMMGQIFGEKTLCEQKKSSVEQQLQVLKAQMDKEIQSGTTIFQIRAFTTMIDHGKKQLEGLRRSLAILDEELERQREIVAEASKEVSKLEKLRDKQLEEYRQADVKEQETLVSEHVASQFVRNGVS